MKKIGEIIFWSILGVAGIAVYIIAAFVPPALFCWLLAFLGCDLGLAILFSMAFFAIWAMILPSLFDQKYEIRSSKIL
jgi:hypothetical protein